MVGIVRAIFAAMIAGVVTLIGVGFALSPEKLAVLMAVLVYIITWYAQNRQMKDLEIV